MKKDSVQVNLLHILNDGFKSSLLLFLPFIAKEFAISLTQVGFLGSAINSIEIILAVPASHLASKIGGKKVLVGVILFSSIGFLLTAIAPNYGFVILAFIVAGIGYGIFHPVAFALLSRIFEKGERGKQLGNFTALGELGKVGLSSAITFIIVYIGWRNTAGAIALLLFFICVYFVQLIKKDSVIPELAKGDSTNATYKDVLKNKRFLLSTLSFCLDTFASGSLFVFIPFLLIERHVPFAYLGLLTSTFFVGSMLGKIFLGRLVDKFGNITVFIASEICMAIFIMALSNATWLPVIILSSIILGVFTKGTVPVLVSMVAESVDHQKGIDKAIGLNATFVGMASTITPFLLGYLSDTFGIVTAFNYSAGFALLAIVPAFFLSRFKHSYV